MFLKKHKILKYTCLLSNYFFPVLYGEIREVSQKKLRTVTFRELLAFSHMCILFKASVNIYLYRPHWLRKWIISKTMLNFITLLQSLLCGCRVYILPEVFWSNRKTINEIMQNCYVWHIFILIYCQSHRCVTVCFRCGVWSWSWFQLSSHVLFRSFCGLGLLSNDYPGSPYPKKHLQGTLTSMTTCIKFLPDTWGEFLYLCPVSVYSCRKVIWFLHLTLVIDLISLLL